jgi:hypothetical protein
MIGLPKLQELSDMVENVVDAEVKDPDEALIGAAMLIVEIKDKAADESVFFTFCTDRRTWVQRAMLNEATETVNELAPQELDDD